MKSGKQIKQSIDKTFVSTPESCFQSFILLLNKIQRTNWKSVMIQTVKKYSLESYKLTQLTPKNVEILYKKICKKYQSNQRQRMAWYQNQLRIYIWFLAATTEFFNLNVANYKHQQLQQLSKPFFGIHQDLCEYQYKSIISPQLYRIWQVEENLLLSQILKKHSTEGSWSNIAKQLFLLSKKKYFRTPQTCRERWQNHLDDRKVRGQWTLQEDCLLIKYILSEGKRWSVIAKKIGDTRTQHMVKNRFQTLLRRQFKSKKKPTRFSQQFQFCRQLLKKLSQKSVSQDIEASSQQNGKFQQEQQHFIIIKKQESLFSNNDNQYTDPIIKVNNLISTRCQPIIEPYFSFLDLQRCEQPLEHNIQNWQHKSDICLKDNQYKIPFDWQQKQSPKQINTQFELQIPQFIDQIIFQNSQDELGIILNH